MGELRSRESAEGDRWTRRLVAGLTGDRALYLVLLLLVWGLTVPMRGLWQDDTLLLRLARQFQGFGLRGALWPIGAPLRRLYALPFRLALATPQPIWTLHLIYGLTWLGQALAAGWIVRLLLPGRRLIQFLAICLTLTATSDYLTGNLTALGYNTGALLLLLAAGCSLRYVTGGGAAWVVLAAAAAAASIWTIDVGIPALPFLPLLLFWRGGVASVRRSLVVLSAIALALAPAVPIEWQFLHDPTSYAAVAMQPIPLAARIGRALVLWYENFTPWRWVFSRPVWYPRPPAVLRARVMAPLAAAAAAWFVFRARRAESSERQESSPHLKSQTPVVEEGSESTSGAKPPEGIVRILLLVANFALMALVANAAYAGLQMAVVHYRTHILSRVWASLAVAVLAGWAMQRWPRFRNGFLLVPVVFVGFGVWGGLERQNLWVSTWRLHQKELLSIVTTAPAFVPGTSVILRSQPTPDLYLATEAEYLAQCWLILLYDDPAIHALRMAPDRGTGCRATSEGLDCWHEEQAACVAAGTCAADRFDYKTLVILDFDDRRGIWRLVADPRGDALLGGSSAALDGYRPAGRILQRPLTPRQRALLLQ